MQADSDAQFHGKLLSETSSLSPSPLKQRTDERDRWISALGPPSPQRCGFHTQLVACLKQRERHPADPTQIGPQRHLFGCSQEEKYGLGSHSLMKLRKNSFGRTGRVLESLGIKWRSDVRDGDTRLPRVR